MVARMRCWWTPWPSCTSECSLSRSHGMSRDTASSRMACVDGPNAVRCGLQQEPLQLGVEVELRVGADQVVHQPDRQGAGGQADLLVDVPVDDVVLTRDAGAAGLAAPHVVAGLLLQLQRGVLGDVAEPGALLEPLEEAAAVAARARVPGERRAARRPARRRSRGSCCWGGPPASRGRRRGARPARRTTGSARGRPATAGSPGRVAALTVSSSSWGRLLIWCARCSSWKSTSRRCSRSNRAPDGRVCTTTPDTSSGAPSSAMCASLTALGPVGDEDAAGADDLEQVPAADHGRGVLVDAEAEQPRRAGHQRQQPAVPVALREVLVDDHVRQQAEAGGRRGDALPRGVRLVAEGDHVLADGARARRRTADQGTALVRRPHRVGEPRCRRRSGSA